MAVSDLQVFPVAAPGGINQSAPEPTPADLEELKNFAIFRNRVGLRAPIATIATLLDDQVSAVEVDAVLDIVDHQQNLWALGWSSSQQDVYLYSMQVDGTSLTIEAVVHTGVVSKPNLKLISFTGGDANSPEDRIYVVDFNQNLNTVYYNGAIVTTVTEDLDVSGSAENIQFSLMFPFKFHLFASGFYEGTTSRGEILRFSTPGLIPENDSAGGTPLSKEWLTNDFLSIGTRGDKIVALSQAGDRLLVFQKRATHAVFGSGRNTWTVQNISQVVGCVGPHAVTSIDERVAYFWASDGPYRTDGTSLQYIGQPIRQLAVSVDASQRDTQVGHSPDDGIVNFLVSDGGADRYSLSLQFDHRRERWLKAEWVDSGGNRLEFGALEFLDSAAPPGPEAAPSSPAVSATSDTTATVSWVNGDVNVNTETHIYRSLSSGFTPNDATNRVGVVSSGATSFMDSGLTADTEYFYKLRHFRNSSHSSESSEVSDTTWLVEPTSMGLAGLTDGLTVTGTNNATGADIVIQRRLSGGSFSTIATLLAPGATFSHNDTGLMVGTEYFYRTKATLGGSTDSEWSATISREAGDATTAPSAPSGLNAVANGQTQIDLSWADNSDNEDAFEVHRASTSGGAFTLIASLGANSTSYSDIGLSSDEDYFYKVRATNNAGDSPFTSEAGATTDPNLNPPSDLVATAISPSRIDLSWTDTASDETDWEVERTSSPDDDCATSGNGFSQIIATVTGTGTKSVQDTGLSESMTYYYRVRAVKGTISGAYSNESCAVTPEGLAPNAPSNLVAVKNPGSPSDTIDLTWTDNASDEDSFEIHRRTSGGFTQIGTAAQDATSFQDTPVSAGTTYTYKVRAINSNGASAFSNEDAATTDGAPSPPADPTNLIVTPDNADLGGLETSAVDLSWTDNANNEDNYIVERCQGVGCTSWAQIASLPAGTNSYRDVGVVDNETQDTIYRYRVKATNGQGDSAYVTSADITVEPQCTPSGVVASDSSFCNTNIAVPRLSVSWSFGDTNGMVSVKVERSKNAAAFVTILEDTTNPEIRTSFSDTSVSFGDNYRYRIIANFGSTGENTGEFTSSPTGSVTPIDPDCSTEI